MNSFVIRIISALVAIFLLIFTYIVFANTGLYYLAAGIVLIGCHEYYNIQISTKVKSLLHRILFFGFATLIVINPSITQMLVIATLGIVLLSVSTLVATRNSEIDNSNLLNIINTSAFALIYAAALPKFAMSFIFNNELHLFTALLIIVFSSDTFAYLGGLKFGKTPLMPKLSPKKTIEGSVSGLIGSAVITTVFIKFIAELDFSYVFVVLTALFIAAVSQIGDLLQSLIKRDAGVKDSGKIMPGHGGVLDRLDAVYAAAPIFWFFYTTSLIF